MSSEYDMVPRSGGLKLKKIDHTIKKKKKKAEVAETPGKNKPSGCGGGASSKVDIDAAIEAKLRERNPLMHKTKAELRFLQMQEKN